MARRRPVQKSERFGATPETAAKLRPDPLQVLMRTANMGPAEERAAAEIRSVYLAVCRVNFALCAVCTIFIYLNIVHSAIAASYFDVYPWFSVIA